MFFKVHKAVFQGPCCVWSEEGLCGVGRRGGGGGGGGGGGLLLNKPSLLMAFLSHLL